MNLRVFCNFLRERLIYRGSLAKGDARNLRDFVGRLAQVEPVLEAVDEHQRVITAIHSWPFTALGVVPKKDRMCRCCLAQHRGVANMQFTSAKTAFER